MINNTTPELIGNLIESIEDRFNQELYALQENELEKKYWHFRWDEKQSIECNIYQFSTLLELFKHFCERWEEYHHGISCVVERVRDKYLWSKIQEFRAELEKRLGVKP